MRSIAIPVVLVLILSLAGCGTSGHRKVDNYPYHDPSGSAIESMSSNPHMNASMYYERSHSGFLYHNHRRR